MAAIAYWCATRHVPAVEQQIQANAQAAVSSAGANNVSASVHGRTVSLSGSVGSDAEKSELLSALSEADGVRHVNDELLTITGNPVVATNLATTTPEPTEALESNEQTSQPTKLAVATTDTTQTITTEDTATEAPTPEPAVVQTPTPPSPTPQAPAAAEPVANTPSNETLAPVAPVVSPPTPQAPVPEAPALAAPPPPPSLEAPPQAPHAPHGPGPHAPHAPQPVAPTLEAPSPEAPSSSSTSPVENTQPIEDLAELGEVNEQAPTSLADAPLEESENSSPVFVDVLEEEEGSSSFSMQITDGTLTLTGDISTEDDSLAFIQSAMRTFDVNYLVNSMQVNDENAKANWLPALTEFIPTMQTVSDARIDISDFQITLSGIVPDPQSHDEVIDQALSLLSELSLIDRIAVASGETNNSDSAPVTTPTAESADTVTQDTTQNAIQPSSSADSLASSTTPEQLSTLREAFRALEAERILFRSGSDVLTDQSVQTVAAMSALLSKYPDITIEIDGHTDSLGSSEDNLRLSQLRANAVRDLMIDRGIARERLSAYGFGDGVPIADNNTAEGRKLNRLSVG